MTKRSKPGIDSSPKTTTWLNSRTGCITVIAGCFLFIAVFIANIIVKHAWVNLLFIAVYGAIVWNRLKQLRTLE